MKAFTAVLLPALLGACATAPDEQPTAPTPYTAEEIRAGNPVGTLLVYRIQRTGTPTVVRTMEFVRADPRGARIASSTITEGSAPVGAGGDASGDVSGDAPSASDALWTELRDHAAFPAARTLRSRASCTVPAGSYDCQLYTVTGEEDGVPTLTRYWFARERPGPPVLVEKEKEGAVVFRVELMDVRHGAAD